MIINKFQGGIGILGATLAVESHDLAGLTTNQGMGARLIVTLHPEHLTGGPDEDKGEGRMEEVAHLQVVATPFLAEKRL